jgi:hypothetical protein
MRIALGLVVLTATLFGVNAAIAQNKNSGSAGGSAGDKWNQELVNKQLQNAQKPKAGTTDTRAVGNPNHVTDKKTGTK